jgi:trigger factor
MQEVKIEELSSIKRKISLQVESEKVEGKISDFFKEFQKDAQINGFRKGKVPLDILKAKFADQSRAMVSQSLLVEGYDEAVKAHNLNPVGKPVIEGFTPTSKYPGTFEKDNTFKVNLLVEVLPTISPVGYTGMTLDIPKRDLDVQVEQKLAALREQFAERVQVSDRPAKLGDSLVLDFKGFLDGKLFDGGSASNFTMDKLGSANFIPGFEEQLVDMKVGETKTVDVTFPEKYGAAHLAGKPAKFEVTLHSVVETKLAEMNTDLAMMAGHETVEALQQSVKDTVASETTRQDRGKIEFQIIKELLKTNEFEVPNSMVESEFKRILNQISGGKTPQLQKEVQESLRNTAKTNVQRALLFDAIYDKEQGLEVGPDELDALLEEHAKKNNKTKDELVSLLYNTNQMDNFMGVLKNNKVVDFILKSANSKESEESNGPGSNGNNGDSSVSVSDPK